MQSAVIVSIRVKAEPLAAFSAFTDQIGRWWQSHPLFPMQAERIWFEGGRLQAILTDGRAFEVGQVTEWRPGERLAMDWRFPSFGPADVTSLEVDFVAVEGETRVTVTHMGWDGIPARHAARHGFPLMAIQGRAAEHWRAMLGKFATLIG